MAITHNTSYVLQGLSRLLQQFKGKPRIAVMLTSWLEEAQQVEDALWDIYYDRLLQNDNATTDILTQYGELVGQASEGLSDDIFKLLILARIRANRSDGTVKDLIAVTTILESGSRIVGLELFPATYYIQVDTPGSSPQVPPGIVLSSFLARAVAAGVRIVFVFSVEPEASTLKFGSVYGFSSIPQPTQYQSPGSFYIGAIGAGLFASVQQF